MGRFRKVKGGREGEKNFGGLLPDSSVIEIDDKGKVRVGWVPSVDCPIERRCVHIYSWDLSQRQPGQANCGARGTVSKISSILEDFGEATRSDRDSVANRNNLDF